MNDCRGVTHKETANCVRKQTGGRESRSHHYLRSADNAIKAHYTRATVIHAGILLAHCFAHVTAAAAAAAAAGVVMIFKIIILFSLLGNLFGGGGL